MSIEFFLNSEVDGIEGLLPSPNVLLSLLLPKVIGLLKEHELTHLFCNSRGGRQHAQIKLLLLMFMADGNSCILDHCTTGQRTLNMT